MRRGYVDVPEGQIHYQTEGSGEPLLLLHQSPQSSDEFINLIPLLSKNYRVIAMDTLGYGKSDSPPRQYEIADYTRSVVNFLKALKIKKTSVLGHHTGASIGVELAAAYPQLVDKLILFGCPNFKPEMLEHYLSDPGFQPMQLKRDGSHVMAIWKHGLEWGPKDDLQALHFLFATYMTTNERIMPGFIAAFRYNSGERLPLINCPTLLITGDRDVLFDQHESVKQLIPRCRAKIIKGAEIYPVAMAQAVAPEVLQFLHNPGV